MDFIINSLKISPTFFLASATAMDNIQGICRLDNEKNHQFFKIRQKQNQIFN